MFQHLLPPLLSPPDPLLAPLLAPFLPPCWPPCWPPNPVIIQSVTVSLAPPAGAELEPSV